MAGVRGAPRPGLAPKQRLSGRCYEGSARLTSAVDPQRLGSARPGRWIGAVCVGALGAQARWGLGRVRSTSVSRSLAVAPGAGSWEGAGGAVGRTERDGKWPGRPRARPCLAQATAGLRDVSPSSDAAKGGIAASGLADRGPRAHAGPTQGPSSGAAGKFASVLCPQ